MRISAIVCAYNEETLLPAALHSLFAQTRAAGRSARRQQRQHRRDPRRGERIPGVHGG